MTRAAPSTEQSRHLIEKYESSVEAMLPIREKILQRVLRGIDKREALLDVGHGIGENLRIMQAWGYENAAGVDNDPAMQPPTLARGCQNLILGDVRRLDPGEKQYALVFAQAFLHIYPKAQAPAVLTQLVALARQRLYLSMKVHEAPSEGLEEKMSGMKRFRARYTWDEIEGLVRRTAEPAGWRVETFPLTDPLARAWINVVCDR